VLVSRLRAHCVVAAALAAASTGAACSSSSSTGPAITQAQIVAHYDQLAGAYLAGSAGTDPAIGNVIEIFNGALADGATVGNGTLYGITASHGWLTDVVDLVDSSGQDSVQIASLWYSGTVGGTIQLFYSQGVFSTAVTIDSGSTELQDSVAAATISVSPATAPDTCSFVAITNISSQYPTYDPSGSSCELIVATVTADTLIFPLSDSSNTAYLFANFKIPAQTFHGARLQFNSEAAFSSAVVHALAETKRRR
jgi:hypothetical protein